MWWFSRGTRVLAVGSVHLDTIALSEHSATLGETEIGSITYSVGGSAYNVAANLAAHRPTSKVVTSAAIYSILPQHSVLTEIFKYKCLAAGVSAKYLRLHKDFNHKRVRGGGYVGILDANNRLIRNAVVDAAMYETDIFQQPEEASVLERAIAWADMLVIDADLAVPTVNHIAEHARNNAKPFFISVGSPLAGMRTLLMSHVTNKATCVGGRLLVICALLSKLKVPEVEIEAFRAFVATGDSDARFDINAICRHLKTDFLVCSNVRESQGFALLAAGDPACRCFFATPEDVRSRMHQGNSAGVVDGALAGFIDAYAQVAGGRGKKVAASAIVGDETAQTFKASILDMVEHVSESEGATPGSVVSFEEQASEQGQLAKLRRLTRIAFDMLPVFRYLLSIGALIIALWLFETALDVLKYFGINVPLPETPWLRMLLRR